MIPGPDFGHPKIHFQKNPWKKCCLSNSPGQRRTSHHLCTIGWTNWRSTSGNANLISSLIQRNFFFSPPKFSLVFVHPLIFLTKNSHSSETFLKSGRFIGWQDAFRCTSFDRQIKSNPTQATSVKHILSKKNLQNKSLQYNRFATLSSTFMVASWAAACNKRAQNSLIA